MLIQYYNYNPDDIVYYVDTVNNSISSGTVQQTNIEISSSTSIHYNVLLSNNNSVDSDERNLFSSLSSAVTFLKALMS